ncbi:glycosyltransferase [Marinitenerispora sediminis]|uniref:Glycosyl transferase family 2 n=1 Tax=Marinitenerispora sediminis TaxID=1931232 RepID=A0A368T9F2_9ACTN|nr:glycosyltransferase [Marinitenerispora sediminis]RCV55680.1 glycosyl transferase family 2 [Marinitenerispora sediminis]RCV57732.1 glycosyl transferase family 2 [Marinitenerispora sediminis]RCV60904.1 glycosyl transferase family 2 [Marinitenerispora sediminis]
MLPLDPARHIVTAVVVTHDGARWLPETLEAVRGQSRPVQRVVGVDTGSRDRSGAILAEFIAPEAILTLPRDTGYGDAVRAALEHPRSRTEYPSQAEATEWVWLIHDDCTPAPDALDRLLAAAEDDPRAAILGPKLRDWFDRRVLVEAGVTIDGAGRRETGLEPREYDQGQHDGTRQVLAVSSAGMLVRRDVWETLDGFDPGLPLFRDDIDLCWRAGGAGHRVLVVTDAVAYHAEAAARRRRRISAAADHPRRIDRRNALFVLLANMPFGAMVGALLRNSVASFLRVLMYLVAKQPANALDEAVAITLVYLTPVRLVRARFRRRRNRRRTYSAIQPFLAHGVALRQFADLVGNLLSGSPALDTPGRHQAVTTGPPEEDDPLRDDQSLLRRALTHPGVLLVTGLVAVSLVAERSLLLGGRLAGGALPPVTGTAGDLWSMYVASWHDVGLGSAAVAPPYVGMLAVLSTIALGKPALAVTVILLGCVPLAGFTAYLLARRVLHGRAAQLWMAGSYALLPVATGAVAQGRLGTALVHAIFPVLGILVTRILTLPPRQSRRAAWALALFLAVATAFVPLVWVLALVTGALIAVAFAHVGRRLLVSLAIALLAPLVLLLPWTLDLFRHPSLWLLEAGLHRPDLSDAGLSASALLLLSPGGPGLPPIWVTGGFIAAALCALLLLRRRMLVAVGWSVALFGILVAIAVSRVNLAPPQGGPVAAAWPGVALAFAATAMLLSAAVAAQSFGLLYRLGGLRRVFALALAALALTTPVAAAGVWMWNGVEGPLTGHARPAIPPFLESLSSDGTQARTLVVAPAQDGSVQYSVLRGREPRIGEPQIPTDENVRTQLDSVVAALTAGRGGDEAETLAQFGIRYVLVPAPALADGVDVTLVDTMDGIPGLSRLQLNTDFALWRLDEPTGRLRIVEAAAEGGPEAATADDGQAVRGDDGDAGPVVLRSGPVEADVEVPEGSGPRTLVLAEPADGGWRATLDGTELAGAASATGLQTFALPASGGQLEITRTGIARQVWLVVQGVLFLAVVVLALPGARTEEEARQQAEHPSPRPRRPRRRRAAGGARWWGRGTRGRRAAKRGSRSADR